MMAQETQMVFSPRFPVRVNAICVYHKQAVRLKLKVIASHKCRAQFPIYIGGHLPGIVPISETLALIIPESLSFGTFPVVPRTTVVSVPEPESLQEIQGISFRIVIVPRIGLHGMTVFDPAAYAPAF